MSTDKVIEKYPFKSGHRVLVYVVSAYHGDQMTVCVTQSLSQTQ